MREPGLREVQGGTQSHIIRDVTKEELEPVLSALSAMLRYSSSPGHLPKEGSREEQTKNKL